MYITTIKNCDVFELIQQEKAIGTIEIRKRKGQLQLAFSLPDITVNKVTQHEVKHEPKKES